MFWEWFDFAFLMLMTYVAPFILLSLFRDTMKKERKTRWDWAYGIFVGIAGTWGLINLVRVLVEGPRVPTELP